MNKKSRILIFGSNGFVGRTLKKTLEQKYTNIIGVSRKDGDFTKYDDVKNIILLHRPEYVFMCAASVGGIKANINNQFDFLLNNLKIQNNIIDLCIQNKVKKVLNLGSSCIYPKDYKQPLKEEYLLNAPLEPTNEGYALAKIIGLKLCEYANKEKDSTKFISLMPCNLYGHGDNFDLDKSHVLGALIKKICDAKKNNIDTVEIWGTGKARREFLYIDDLIDCMIWSMNNIEKTDTFLNVGSGYDIPIILLAETIQKESGYTGKFIFDTSKPEGMMLKCTDVSKINKLGWKKKIHIQDGIRKTIKYYEELND